MNDQALLREWLTDYLGMMERLVNLPDVPPDHAALAPLRARIEAVREWLAKAANRERLC